MKSLLPVIGIFFLIIVPISFAIFDEIINILFWCLIWLYVLYRARGLMKSPEEKKQVIEDAIDSVRTKVAENQIDDMYISCMKRDRTQSFDDWISLAIQGMAIDEIEKGKLEVLHGPLDWGHLNYKGYKTVSDFITQNKPQN